MAFERKNYKKLKHDFGNGEPHFLTNDELHRDIVAWMEEYIPEYKDIAEILDYSLPHNDNWRVPYEDSVIAIVNTGGSESIYLDVYFCQQEKKHRVMVFKTPYAYIDAYMKMGMLAGILTAAIENYQYQNKENLLKWED